MQIGGSFINSLWERHHYAAAILVLPVAMIIPLIIVSKAWGGGRLGIGCREEEKEVPGSLGFPYIGETLSFLWALKSNKGCYEFVRQRRKRYGDWFKTSLFGVTNVFVPTAAGAKFVFANDCTMFGKRYIKSMGKAIGERSLFAVSPEDHARLAGIMSGFFHMSSLHVLVKKVDAMVIHRLEKLANDAQSFTVLGFAHKLTLDAICNMLLGEVEEEMLEEIARNVDDLTAMLLSLPIMLPGTRYYRGLQARKRLSNIFMDMIHYHRKVLATSSKPVFDGGFLQEMLELEIKGKSEKLTDQEILDNMITLMLSGQSSASVSIMWCIKFLSDNEHVQEKLRDEQLDLAKKRPNGALLTMEELNAMPYANNVIKETLRLASVVEWFPRLAKVDCEIDGFKIKKGWNVNIDAAQIHRDPNVYKNPMEFDPSRFDEAQKPYIFVPFGVGPRSCTGMNLAKVVMLVFLHRITGGYKWKLNDTDSSLLKNSFQPKLKNGCPITLTALKDR